jgi:hypothetical protein
MEAAPSGLALIALYGGIAMLRFMQRGCNASCEVRQPPSWLYRLFDGFRCRSGASPSGLGLRFGVAR